MKCLQCGTQLRITDIERDIDWINDPPRPAISRWGRIECQECGKKHEIEDPLGTGGPPGSGVHFRIIDFEPDN